MTHHHGRQPDDDPRREKRNASRHDGGSDPGGSGNFGYQPKENQPQSGYGDCAYDIRDRGNPALRQYRGKQFSRESCEQPNQKIGCNAGGKDGKELQYEGYGLELFGDREEPHLAPRQPGLQLGPNIHSVFSASALADLLEQPGNFNWLFAQFAGNDQLLAAA